MYGVEHEVQILYYMLKITNMPAMQNRTAGLWSELEPSIFITCCHCFNSLCELEVWKRKRPKAMRKYLEIYFKGKGKATAFRTACHWILF
jgi:hypothetical protein